MPTVSIVPKLILLHDVLNLENTTFMGNVAMCSVIRVKRAQPDGWDTVIKFKKFAILKENEFTINSLRPADG